MSGKMLLYCLVFSFLAATSLSQPVSIPQLPQNSTLYEALIPTFIPTISPATFALFPIQIITSETPIAARYTLITNVILYDSHAPCHPTALSFFGVRDTYPSEWCTPRSDQIAIIHSFAALRAIEREFPSEARFFIGYLLQAGLNVMDRSLDMTTPVGMGNMMGYRAAEYFSRDGFNSLGDMTRKLNKQRFSDPTGYQPENIAGTDPSELPKPLRWTPLIQESDGKGRFISEVHITPHIGLTANPAALTREEVEARVHEGPYKTPDREKSLSEEDEATMLALLDDFLAVSRNLTQQQVISARFWDNKFTSLALVQVYTGLAWRLNDFEVARVGLGDIIAQYDAIIVAWKEKRMHDLTRPTTMIRRFFSGKNISAYVNELQSAGLVLGEEYEPLFKVMPHSEFPSGSALICTAFFEHHEMFAMTRREGDMILPTKIPIFPNTTLFPLDGPAFVDIPSFKGAAEQCSTSRLWAGVHFRPAVEAAQKLAEGIGKRAFEFVSDLVEGKVPEKCTHCLTF